MLPRGSRIPLEPQLVATGPARDEQGVPRTVRGRERRWLRWQRMRRRGELRPAGPFRRAGFLRAVRRPAQRDSAAGPGAARHHGAAPGARPPHNDWKTTDRTQ